MLHRSIHFVSGFTPASGRIGSPPPFDHIASPRRNASLLYLPGPSGPAFFSAGQRMVILVLEVILEEVIEKD